MFYKLKGKNITLTNDFKFVVIYVITIILP